MKNYLPVICILLTGCTQSSALVNNDDGPSWLHGEPAEYPHTQYVYATGSAAESEVAKDRALGNLAKIFELHIHESSTTTQDVQTQKTDGVESVKSSARIASKVNVYTSKMINGARIAAQWQNPDDLTHYALAVLDRAQASNYVRGEIYRLDRAIAFTMTNAENHQDILQQVADLQDAIEMQSERNSLQKTLQIIDLAGRGKPSSWSLSALTARQMRLLKSLNISGDVLVDSVGGLDQVFQGAMAHAGFTQTASNPAYTLSASMETLEALQKQGWYWLRGTLEVSLASAEGAVLGSRAWPLKVSSQQENQLNRRMLAKIDKTLKSELKDTVLGFATGAE